MSVKGLIFIDNSQNFVNNPLKMGKIFEHYFSLKRYTDDN